MNNDANAEWDHGTPHPPTHNYITVLVIKNKFTTIIYTNRKCKRKSPLHALANYDCSEPHQQKRRDIA